MALFGKKKTSPIPEECRGMEVMTESSTCTGERTIGFFDPVTGRLRYTELVRSEEDVIAFCRRYGVEYPPKKK